MCSRDLNRRDLLKASGSAAAALAVPISTQPVSANGDPPSDCIDNSIVRREEANVVGTVYFQPRDELTLEYEIDDGVDDLSVELLEPEKVVSTFGFEREGEDEDPRVDMESQRFQWDGDTPQPTITYEGMSVSSYDWNSGIFTIPGHTSGSTVALRANEGVVSRNLMYVGEPHTVSELRNGCEYIRLIVPCGVHVASTASDVANALQFASEYLDVGHRYSEFTMFAAKDVLNFSVRGFYIGDGDAATKGSRPVNSPGDTWTHEYVHSRQADNLAWDMEWFMEGSADYYAARITLEQEKITASSYESYLNRGQRHDDAILSEPDTWGIRTDYEKGALILAILDERITEESGGDHSLQTVFRRMNESEVTVAYQDFRDMVTDVAHARTGEWLDTYVTTDAVPPSFQYSGEKGTGMDAYLIQVDQVVDSATDYVSHILAPPGECGRGGYFI